MAKAPIMNYCEMQDAMKAFAAEHGMRELILCSYGALVDTIKAGNTPHYELKSSKCHAESSVYAIEQALKALAPKVDKAA